MKVVLVTEAVDYGVVHIDCGLYEGNFDWVGLHFEKIGDNVYINLRNFLWRRLSKFDGEDKLFIINPKGDFEVLENGTIVARGFDNILELQKSLVENIRDAINCALMEQLQGEIVIWEE